MISTSDAIRYSKRRIMFVNLKKIKLNKLSFKRKYTL